jgi:hypothetical protein
MARYLSPEWFSQVTAAASPPRDTGALMVLEQVVRDTPDGEVAYRVVVGQGDARIVWPIAGDAPPPDMRISCDWATAVAVAKGDLSAQRALMQGKLRVRGNPSRLAGDPAVGIGGFDPVPDAVRNSTTY